MKIDIEPGSGRPSWLRDDDITFNRTYYDLENFPHSPRRAANCDHIGEGWTDMASFEIDDDHPYAVATSKGFTYWPGGAEEPDDIDKNGQILFRNGRTSEYSIGGWWWGRPLYGSIDYEIIGYKALPAQEDDFVFDLSQVFVFTPCPLTVDLITSYLEYECGCTYLAAKVREHFTAPAAPTDPRVETLRPLLNDNEPLIQQVLEALDAAA